MEVWQLLLYAFASVLALRCLMALMTAHKQRLQANIAAEQERKRREEQAKAKKEKEKQKKAAASAAKGRRANGTAA